MTIPSRPLKDSEKAMLIDDVFHFDITQYVDIRIYHDKYNPKQPDNQAWTVPPLIDLLRK